jgi:hypothetical protein
MEGGIGCKEFARIICASYPEVSRAASAGLLRVVGTRGNRRGPGVHIFDREEAHRIAAAVRCGIPWRVAAIVSARIKIIRGGGIRIIPLDTTAAGTTSAIRHRAHRKDARFTPAVGEQQCAARMRPPIDADQN